MPATSHQEADLTALIRGQGMRVTPPRLAVCEYLQSATGPVTHAMVAQALVPKGIDQATVFRNLVSLADSNLVRKLDLGDHLYRYEWCGEEAAESPHAHFVCVQCGEVICLTDLHRLAACHARRLAGDLIRDITDIVYKGHCSNCG